MLQQQPQQLYRAIYDYQGEDHHEFTLRVGDLVTCEQQQNNGWWGGMNLRTNRKGWYPCSFVEPVAVATTTHSSSSPLLSTRSHPSPTVANTPSANNNNNKDHCWAAHSESIIPMVHAVPVPSQQPTWSSVQVAGPPQQREGPPSWSVPSSAAVSSSASCRRNSSSGSDVVAGVGHWLKNGLAHSSIGHHHHGQPPVHQHQTVTVQETQVQRSGSWFFGPSSTTSVVSKQSTTTTTQLPAQTGVGLTAKKVGDTAVMSAVWGATTLHPKQMLSAAAVAVAAYGIEGNQRAKAQQQQEDYLREQRALAERARIEADQRRKEEEERRKASSWFKW
jgi:hypothetical protein